jgi:pilus assembly protein Flp/PilA
VIDLINYWKSYCEPFLRARFGRDERGASLVEYGLLVALIAVVCIAAISFLGGEASDKFNDVGSKLGDTPATAP